MPSTYDAILTNSPKFDQTHDAMKHLSDGTLVFAVWDNGWTRVFHSPDGTNLTEIYATNTVFVVGVTIVVDNADNVYIVGITQSSGGTHIGAVCLKKGAGFSWTAAAVVGALNSVANSGIYIYPNAVWCNTGGGANGKGHIVAAVMDGTYAHRVQVLDAGVIYNGGGSLDVNSYTNPTFVGAANGSSAAANGISLSQEGFGSPNIVIANRKANYYINAGSAIVSAAGALTSQVDIGIVATHANFASYPWLHLLYIAPNVFGLIFPNSGDKERIMAARISKTAVLSGGVTSEALTTFTPAGESFPAVWVGQPYVDPLTPGRVHFLWASYANTWVQYIYVDLLTGTTWGAEDYLNTVGEWQSNSAVNRKLRVVKQPRRTRVDYQVEYLKADLSGRVLGGAFTQYNAAPFAPTLTSPNGGENWTGLHDITWTAAVDWEQAAATLRYHIQYTTNGGSTWTDIVALTAAGVTTYAFNFATLPASTAVRLRIRAYDGTNYGPWDESNANFTIEHNQAPFAPTLQAPPNNSVQNLAFAAALFDWLFNDPNAGDTMSAFYFRRKLSGAGSYEYWNAGTNAWQSTEIKNARIVSDYTFPTAKWENGKVYNWSVATEDNQGVKGPYATDWTVVTSQPASVVVTAPTGTVVGSSFPNIEWTMSDPEGEPQGRYRTKVFTAAQYTAGGFNPETSPSTWDSGDVVSAAARNHQVPIELPNLTTYRAYVKVESANQWSDWAFSGFTINLTQPAPPDLVATYEPEDVRNRLDLLDARNLLDLQQSTLSQAGTAGLAAMTNSSIARVAPVDLAPTLGAVEATATAAGNSSIATSGVVSLGFVPGETYTAMAQIRATADGRVGAVAIRWRDAAGAVIAGWTYGPDTPLTNGSREWVFGTFVAPAGAVRADLVVLVKATAAGETWQASRLGMRAGSVQTWSPGGFSLTGRVEFSDDGGSTWEYFRILALASDDLLPVDDGDRAIITFTTPRITVYDYTAEPNKPRMYRARSFAEV